MEEESIVLLYKRINKYRGSEGNTKSPLGQHSSNNCHRQDPPLIDAKISERKFEEIQDVCVISISLYTPRHLLITKGRTAVIIQQRHSGETCQTQP